MCHDQKVLIFNLTLINDDDFSPAQKQRAGSTHF